MPSGVDDAEMTGPPDRDRFAGRMVDSQNTKFNPIAFCVSQLVSIGHVGLPRIPRNAEWWVTD
jgi:hypothetical protein